MNARILLGFSLMMLSSCVAGAVTIQEATVTNQWSQPVSRVLQSAGGAIDAQVQYYRHDAHFRDGSVAIKMHELVLIPESGLIWIGNPCEQYFVLGDAIVGIRPSVQGNIFINRQSTRIQGTPAEQMEKIQEIRQNAAGKLREAGVGGVLNGTETVSLAKLIGYDPFDDPRSARGSERPTIAGISVMGKEAVIELVGKNGAKVSVAFDQEMRVVRLSADGKVVHPKTEDAGSD
jgi:hypothetical protein